MGIELIHAIDIEDYDGVVVERIKFDSPFEIKTEKIYVTNFETIDVLKSTKENILRLQFTGDLDGTYDLHEVDECAIELIDCIRLESETWDVLFPDDMYDKVYDAMRQIMAPDL